MLNNILSESLLSISRRIGSNVLPEEMIAIASMMAQKVVTASIDPKIQENLIEETLKEMGESTWQS